VLVLVLMFGNMSEVHAATQVEDEVYMPLVLEYPLQMYCVQCPAQSPQYICFTCERIRVIPPLSFGCIPVMQYLQTKQQTKLEPCATHRQVRKDRNREVRKNRNREVIKYICSSRLGLIKMDHRDCGNSQQ
jgi:hypothetical protein